jgi:hypothetical protein
MLDPLLPDIVMIRLLSPQESKTPSLTGHSGGGGQVKEKESGLRKPIETICC